MNEEECRNGRLPVVYVCHPFAGDPAGNANRVREICRLLAREPVVPIGPHIYLPQLIDEGSEREHALTLCMRLVQVCDEVRVYGERVSEGMQREIDHAEAHGIPVRYVEVEAVA